MAGSINKVIIVGNLGRDPEVRSTQDGKEIATLNIATSESWRDRNTGERRERTEWHRVVIFVDALVNIAKNYLKKGAKVYVEGALQTRKWTDQQGVERYSTEIVLQGFNSSLTMLDARQGENGGTYSGGGQSSSSGGGSYQGGSQGGGQRSGGGQPQPAYAQAGAPARGGDLDDDIPF